MTRISTCVADGLGIVVSWMETEREGPEGWSLVEASTETRASFMMGGWVGRWFEMGIVMGVCGVAMKFVFWVTVRKGMLCG